MYIANKKMKYLPIFISLLFFSCTSVHKTVKQPMSHVELNRSDFDLTEQETAEATSVKILNIDFARLFTNKTGFVDEMNNGVISATSIPVVGQYLADRTTSYAFYNLMDNNPGTDFIFYPQTEKKLICPVLGICLINSITTVRVTSRLGTFK